MRYIADLHVHSHYAYATSPSLNLHTLYQWAQVQGIDLVGTGDFTHPAWAQTLSEELVGDGSGFFRLQDPPKEGALPGIKPSARAVRFCLSTEVSCVYRDGEKVRKSHHLLYVPDIGTMRRLNKELGRYGNLAADGRPTLRLSARDLLEIVLTTSPRAHLIPAHIWTPWFAILGSRSGYDSVVDCFQDLTPHIFALETGLSSDPAMNWRLPWLDSYALVSNSDAHSPQNLGREATLFDTEMTYDGLFAALQTRKGLLGTLEFFPEEGKYYLDGHRHCNMSSYPAETATYQRLCPVCEKPLTLGVLHRIEALGSRPASEVPEGKPPFRHLVPLLEVIAQLLGKGKKTKTVERAFIATINRFGNAFDFLLHVPYIAIERHLGAAYARAVRRLREGKVTRTPGYDGRFGTIDFLGSGVA